MDQTTRRHFLKVPAAAVGSAAILAAQSPNDAVRVGAGGVNLYKNEPPGRTAMDNYTVVYKTHAGRRRRSTTPNRRAFRPLPR